MNAPHVTSSNRIPGFLIRSVLLIILLSPWISTVQAVPPELIASRWMTKGQDPTYLDFYPLFGRSASTQIFVQVDLRGDAPIGSSQVDIFLENPILLPDGFDTFASEQILKGNGNDATVQAVLFVDNDIDWAAWTPETTLSLKVSARDSGGAEAVYDLGEVHLYGPMDGGLLPDVLGAEIVEATINSGVTVSIPEGHEDSTFEFPVSVRATDAGKGVEDLTLSYRHENGWTIFVDLDRSDLGSGSFTDGVFNGTAHIGKFAAPGDYNLTSFSTRDKAGNRVFGDEDDLPSTVQKVVPVVNPNAESDPPTLGSPVTITPLVADVRMETVSVKFTFSVNDQGSGFSSGIIRLSHTSDEEADDAWGFFGSFQRTEGDPFMGTYEVDVQIPTDQTAGEYAYQIELNDLSGNSNSYGRQRLGSTFEPMPLPEGSNETITVESEPPPPPDDDTPPVLESIQVTCTHDFATGPGEVEVTLAVSDDMTPLDIGEFFSSGNFVRLTSPTGATVGSNSLTLTDLVSGDALAGTYTIKITMDKAIEAGQYCVLVQLQNEERLRSTYSLNLYDHLPFPNEFSGYCEIINSGAVDCTPPVPIEITATPSMVTEGMETTVLVTVKISDKGTGLQDGSIGVYSGASSLFPFRQLIFSTQTNFLPPDAEGGVGVGTKNEAVYTFEFPLTGTEFSGDFLSFRLSLTDCAGNFRNYDSSICDVRGGYPMPYHIAQIEIINIIDEQDYEAFVLGSNSPFPFSASFEERAYDYDYDGDGVSNGDEFAAGTNMTDSTDRYWAKVIYEPDVGSKVIFRPYNPSTNDYTLYSSLEGENRNENIALNVTAQAYEANSNWGCFLLPPSTGLENLIVAVGALRTKL